MTQQEYNRQHFEKVEKNARNLRLIFNKLIDEISKLPELKLIDIDDTKPFKFSQYKTLNKKVNNLLKDFKKALQDYIQLKSQEAWIDSNNKNNELISQITSTMSLSNEQFRFFNKYKKVNLEALRGFQNRKIKGMRLSDGVWNLTRAYANEIEMALELSIAKGKSAQSIASSMKRYLKEPNRMYQRIRDKHGNLTWSKNAKNYNPGRGVYRSSYQNAMRLARTENNMAYQQADFLKYKSLPMVVGIEVRLSNTHKEKECEVCEEFAGKYPADFKFTLWHPNCKCTSIPILKTPEEIRSDMQALAQGKSINKTSSRQVTEVNPKMIKWIKDNRDKISKARNRPWFYDDNKKFFE